MSAFFEKKKNMKQNEIILQVSDTLNKNTEKFNYLNYVL